MNEQRDARLAGGAGQGAPATEQPPAAEPGPGRPRTSPPPHASPPAAVRSVTGAGSATSASSIAAIQAINPHFRHSYDKDRQQLLRRLSRIEGQVRGIAHMIERDEYCIDILQQTAALRAAIDALSMMVLEDHIAGCLRTAVETGDAAAYTDEVMDVVRRTLGRPVRTPRPAADQE
ncbi:MAG: metal-sensitive transcriptional regulator [Candidatus Limnocylindrales bacterium]